MSAYGTKRTYRVALQGSAFGGKTDISASLRSVAILFLFLRDHPRKRVG